MFVCLFISGCHLTVQLPYRACFKVSLIKQHKLICIYVKCVMLITRLLFLRCSWWFSGRERRLYSRLKGSRARAASCPVACAVVGSRLLAKCVPLLFGGFASAADVTSMSTQAVRILDRLCAFTHGTNCGYYYCIIKTVPISKTN